MDDSRQKNDNGPVPQEYDLSYYSEDLYPSLSKENLSDCNER